MHRVIRILALVLVCQMPRACSTSAERGTEMENFCVFYVRHLPQGTEFNATLCVGSDSALLLTSNLLGGNAIGVFQGKIDGARVGPLRERLLSPEVRSVTPSAKLKPGSLTTVFGCRKKGSDEFQISLMRAEMNEALESLEQEILRVADQLRASPKHVLQGSGSGPTDTIKRKSMIELSITLENAGQKPIKIDNPVVDDPTLPRLRLQLMADKPRERFEDGDYVDEPLVRQALRPRPGEQEPKGRTLTLAPQEKLTFSFGMPVNLSPGRYHAKVAYRNTGKVLGILETAIEGTLMIDLGVLTVGS